MGIIYYRIDYVSSLKCMVPALNINSGYTNAKVPDNMQHGGIYTIHNTAANPPNYYVGISTDISTRFDKRRAAVCELGIEPNVMDQINAYWGKVHCRSYNTMSGLWNHANYSSAVLSIDNKFVDYEHLLMRLIRFYNQNTTLSNNQKINNYFINTSDKCLIVVITSPQPLVQISNRSDDIIVILPTNKPNNFDYNWTVLYTCLEKNSPDDLKELKDKFKGNLWNKVIRPILLNSGRIPFDGLI